MFTAKPNYDKQIDKDNRTLRDLIDRKKKDEAIKFYEEIKNDANSYTWNLMLSLYARLGDIKNSKEYCDKVMNDRLTRIEYKRNAQCMLLDAYANIQDITAESIEQAKKLYSIIDGRGCNRYGKYETTADYKNGIMVKLNARLGQIKNARFYFDKLITPNKAVKSRMLTAYVNAKNITNEDCDEAKSLFQNIGNSANDNDKINMLRIYSNKPILSDQDLQHAANINSSLQVQSDTNRNYMLKIYSKAKIVTNKGIDDVLNKATQIFLSRKNKDDQALIKLMQNINDKMADAAIDIETKEKQEARKELHILANSFDKISDDDVKKARSLFLRIGESANVNDKKNIQNLYNTHAQMEVERIIKNSVTNGEKIYMQSSYEKQMFFKRNQISKNINQNRKRELKSRFSP